MNGCRLSIIELSDNLWAVVFADREKILKAKSFVLGYRSSTKVIEETMARKEYRLWLETYWKRGNLSDDDSDFIS